MKTFKSYLTEEIAWQQSTSKMIFDFNQISNMQIPLTSRTMTWIFNVQLPRVTVFHVTGSDGFNKLKKLQNKKKSISAFFNMNSTYIETGIKTEGGLVVELDASIIMSSKTDILSAPDKTGRRWVELHNIDPTLNMHPELEKMLIDLAIKHDPKKDVISYKNYLKVSPENGINVWWKLKKDVQGDGKKISLIVADYIDGVNTILKKHKKDIQGAIHGYIVRRGTVAVKHPSGRMVGGDSELSEWSAWDEQVVDKIKIEKLHTFPHLNQFDIKKTVIPNLGKIPHKHWKTAEELSTYISQVADAEVRTLGGWAKKK